MANDLDDIPKSDINPFVFDLRQQLLETTGKLANEDFDNVTEANEEYKEYRETASIPTADDASSIYGGILGLAGMMQGRKFDGPKKNDLLEGKSEGTKSISGGSDKQDQFDKLIADDPPDKTGNKFLKDYVDKVEEKLIMNKEIIEDYRSKTSLVTALKDMSQDMDIDFELPGYLEMMDWSIVKLTKLRELYRHIVDRTQRLSMLRNTLAIIATCIAMPVDWSIKRIYEIPEHSIWDAITEFYQYAAGGLEGTFRRLRFDYVLSELSSNPMVQNATAPFFQMIFEAVKFFAMKYIDALKKRQKKLQNAREATNRAIQSKQQHFDSVAEAAGDAMADAFAQRFDDGDSAEGVSVLEEDELQEEVEHTQGPSPSTPPPDIEVNAEKSDVQNMSDMFSEASVASSS
jgi:hypothetical protein